MGQVVPHEVVGMANHNKNIFVGTGGTEGINKSHYLRAVYGHGTDDGESRHSGEESPRLRFRALCKELPIVYVLTVVGRSDDGELVIRGLYIGDDGECFKKASELSLEVNFTMLEKPIKKAIVYLDPSEFKSTWLGNKAIYRTRMAIADGGELLIIAPGVEGIWRRQGNRQAYQKVRIQRNRASAQIRAAKRRFEGKPPVQQPTSSTDPRKGDLRSPTVQAISRKEVEAVNFQYGRLPEMEKRYRVNTLTEGRNLLPDGEEVYYISNPAIGLWAYRERFKD